MSLKYMQGAFKQAGCRTSARGCQARCAADGQRAIFDNKVAEFKQDLPDEVTERLTSVVKSALMSPEDRVLDVGTGSLPQSTRAYHLHRSTFSDIDTPPDQIYVYAAVHESKCVPLGRYSSSHQVESEQHTCAIVHSHLPTSLGVTVLYSYYVHFSRVSTHVCAGSSCTMCCFTQTHMHHLHKAPNRCSNCRRRWFNTLHPISRRARHSRNRCVAQNACRGPENIRSKIKARKRALCKNVARGVRGATHAPG